MVVKDQFREGSVKRLLGFEEGRNAIDRVIGIREPRELDEATGLPKTLKASVYYQLKGFEAHYENKHREVSDVILLHDFNQFHLSILAPAVVKYMTLHLTQFRTHRPFNFVRNNVGADLFRLTIPEYLVEHKIKSLLGMFQYGYSAKGYGSTNENSSVPAFYLLMCITPETLITQLWDKVLEFVKEKFPVFMRNL